MELFNLVIVVGTDIILEQWMFISDIDYLIIWKIILFQLEKLGEAMIIFDVWFNEL